MLGSFIRALSVGVVAVAIVASTTLTSVACSTRLWDRSTAAIVQEAFDGAALAYVPTGQFTVISRNHMRQTRPDFRNRRLPQRYLQRIRAAERIGLLSVSRTEEFARKQNNVTEAMFLDLNGVIDEVVIAPTASGHQYLAREGLSLVTENEWFPITIGRFSNVRVVSNDLEQALGSHYRIVRVTYNAAWTDEFVAYQRARAEYLREQNRPAPAHLENLSPRRKAVVLLELDAFECRWDVITYDIANYDADFHTGHVRRQLEQLQFEKFMGGG